MIILETLSGLLNSRKQAKTLIDELKAKGLLIVREAPPAQLFEVPPFSALPLSSIVNPYTPGVNGLPRPDHR